MLTLISTRGWEAIFDVTMADNSAKPLHTRERLLLNMDNGTLHRIFDKHEAMAVEAHRGLALAGDNNIETINNKSESVKELKKGQGAGADGRRRRKNSRPREGV